MSSQAIINSAKNRFEFSFEVSHDEFYYRLPYKRDYDLTNWQTPKILSGNIIKSYQYREMKPVIIITDIDE